MEGRGEEKKKKKKAMVSYRSLYVIIALFACWLN